MNTADISGQLAIDANALAALRRQAKEDPRAGLKQAAQQFEAVFMQMVLKSMRDATPQDGMFDSDQTRLYQGMFDQQLAQTLAARGATGLASMIEKQLSKAMPAVPDAGGKDAAAAPDSRFGVDTLRAAGRQLVGAVPGTLDGEAAATESSSHADSHREFVDRIWPHAHEAGQATGIPGHFIVAQAALESGWGRGEIRRPDGSPSFNLFNIKAGRGWSGDTVDVATTEYVNGVAQRQVERFRAYRSYGEAFADYAGLLKSSPRYAGVIGQQDGATFAWALQRAGYASDPMYADKLARVIGSATLRHSLSI